MHGVNINTCIRLCTTPDAYAHSTWTRTSVVTSTFTRVLIFFGIPTNRYHVSSLIKDGKDTRTARTQGRQGHKDGKDTRTQGRKDARTQGRKDARTQGCKDARMQGCKDARTQGHKDTRTQGTPSSNNTNDGGGSSGSSGGINLANPAKRQAPTTNESPKQPLRCFCCPRRPVYDRWAGQRAE